MEKRKTFAILSYITWIGWIIAMVKWDRQDTLVRRHLNQALALNVIETLFGAIARMGGVFNTIGNIVDVVVLVLFIMGIVRACKESEEPLPIVGSVEWVK